MKNFRPRPGGHPDQPLPGRHDRYHHGPPGTIDEFIGDAILAVFGAPQRRDDDADRAVQCALAMQAAMAGINALNRAEGLPEINTGIALNTGDVIASNITLSGAASTASSGIR